MTQLEIGSLFATARITDLAATTARNNLAAVMLHAMRNLLVRDTIINLGAQQRPEHLMTVRTVRGNDRGTKTFRIVEVTHVTAYPYAPELSTWSAIAVPISEKTGNEMRGTTSSTDSSATVTIQGDIVCTMLDDIADTCATDRLMNLVAQHASQVAAQAA